MTYRELQKAQEIFALPERATMKQIKGRHRELVKRFHPDRGAEVDPERIRLINAAYRVLLDYCDSYTFSFGEREFYEHNPEERLRMQFSDDPLWGKR